MTSNWYKVVSDDGITLSCRRVAKAGPLAAGVLYVLAGSRQHAVEILADRFDRLRAGRKHNQERKSRAKPEWQCGRGACARKCLPGYRTCRVHREEARKHNEDYRARARTLRKRIKRTTNILKAAAVIRQRTQIEAYAAKAEQAFGGRTNLHLLRQLFKREPERLRAAIRLIIKRNTSRAHTA